MKILNLFQALPMTIVAVANQFSLSVAVEAAAWQADQEDKQLEEWIDMHNGGAGKSLMEENAQKTVTYLRARAMEDNERIRKAASVAVSESTFRDENPSADHPYRTRQLKDKTESMFDDPPVPTSESLSNTKAPKKDCKSTKSPSKAAKSTKGPIASFVFCDSDTSSLPSVAPSESVQPSFVPSESVHPSTVPSESMQPSEAPSESMRPSSKPSESSQPSSNPTESARPSFLPSIQPSESSQPSFGPSISSQPSIYTFPDCPLLDDPPVPRQCFTGSGEDVTEMCNQTNSQCCAPPGACNFGNATVCSGSCNGETACSGITEGAFIDEGSCNGPRACLNCGRLAFSLSIEPGSCNCANSCYYVGRFGRGNSISIGTKSCRGKDSCNRLGGRTMDISIGSYSCNPFQACQLAGSQAITSFFLGDSSCNGKFSCLSLGSGAAANLVSIGTGTCNGYLSCLGLASGILVNGGDNLTLGDDSCNPDRACYKLFGEFLPADTTTTTVSVGNRACNTAPSQCAGSISQPQCYDGTGTYGLMIPDNATSC